MIPFNKPHLTGKETHYIYDAVNSGKLSGNGKYTQLCHKLFKDKFRFGKCLLTTSCTDALEMAAILLDIQDGDEVIMPSYTFVSTANAFVLRGAKIVFVDSRKDHPGMDEDMIEGLITAKTRAIVPVHYAGVACDMDKIMSIASAHDLFVVEDAAQSVDAYFQSSVGGKKSLGSIGHLAAFSFHETKNIISGEGGMLVVNDDRFGDRAEIVWEKGTNRSAFFRGEVDKYGWVDIGSSFLPSEIVSAFLYAQLESIDIIQKRRKEIWNNYQTQLNAWAVNNSVVLPSIPKYASNNAHMYYLVCRSTKARTKLINALRNGGVLSTFHYLSLHKSPFYSKHYRGGDLPESDRYSNCLVRLPLFYDLSHDSQAKVIDIITSLSLKAI